ncbi:MAG: PQQ-binding-like beta-propeller repeat protein [Candidatus Poribacteria bacterium]|nr:PQQ-binding-like beta-propeller repeat protein [Candidatus Poribacteria bacterium]
MKRFTFVVVCYCFISMWAWGAETPSDIERYWPQWRGPHATGVAPHSDPAVEWAEDNNVRWKLEIPGQGHASPIVWHETVFVTTAIETDKPVEPQMNEAAPQSPRRRRGPRTIQPTKVLKFVLLAIDRRDGSIQWQRTAREELPHEGTHPDGSWAANSPVTDGEHIYAYFGSRGLYCFDMQGALKWEKDLGDMTTKLGFGEGSSPVLYGDTIVVNWDHEGSSFIVALDKITGEERWKVDRDETTSWATPIVVDHNGKPQVITSATKRVRSYDLATGELIWESSGMTANAIPSPVATKDMVYVTSGFRGNALHAIRLADAKGEITDSDAVVWQYDRDTPYVPSPLLYGDALYFLKHNQGILSCFNAQTGEAYYGPQRLEGITGVYASPVGARDRVYLVGRNGTTLVIKRGPEFEVLATNSLDDRFEASPAIVDNEIYLRGRKYLYCIAHN